MQSEGSLLCSQEVATGKKPELNNTGCSHKIFLFYRNIAHEPRVRLMKNKHIRVSYRMKFIVPHQFSNLSTRGTKFTAKMVFQAEKAKQLLFIRPISFDWWEDERCSGFYP